MSLGLPLYLHNNLNQAPDLVLNTVVPYAQSVHCLKRKTTDFLNLCGNQLQNTFNVVYPILRHPRSSTTSAILLSTKYIANLTGIERPYKKGCYALSRRADQITSIENQILPKLKKLSAYCVQFNTSYIPWQKLPELQALEELKKELSNNQTPEQAEAISCCNEVYALVSLHRSMRTENLRPEDIQAIEENTAIDTILSSVEENTGEVLGSYAPSLFAPIFHDLLNSIPESYNPLTLVSNRLMTTLKKIAVSISSSSLLSITSSNYFVSSSAQKTLLQLSAITGMSAFGLYYQDHPIMQQVEESTKEILQTFLEIICAYAGMLLFKTDESFKGYFHKIIPATVASRATEYYLDYRESYAVTSFVLPLFASSLVYNRASIQETYQQLKTFSIDILDDEAIKQILSLTNSLITRHINNTLNRFTPTQPQLSEGLNFLTNTSLRKYLTILQQDDMQELLLKIQYKLNRLDPAVEELKNQFLREVFFKKTGTPLPLDNPTLDLLKQSSGLDIQASLFTSFKDALPALRMLWNSYSYHKKVDQTLTLELLLQGLIIIGLADLVPESNAAELPSFSYLKTAGLGIKLAL